MWIYIYIYIYIWCSSIAIPSQISVIWISEMKLDNFYHWRLLDYGLHLYCYIDNVLDDTCLAFFRCFVLNLGAYTKLWTMSFIQSMEFTCSDSINYNWVQGLSIPVLLLPVVRIEPVTSRWLSLRSLGNQCL